MVLKVIIVTRCLCFYSTKLHPKFLLYIQKEDIVDFFFSKCKDWIKGYIESGIRIRAGLFHGSDRVLGFELCYYCDMLLMFYRAKILSQVFL